jgi:large subunit ribosomal protein L11e
VFLFFPEFILINNLILIFSLFIGNFGFGIDEHIDLGIKYDLNTGIFGMDFYVILGRAGKRVSKRKHARGKFGKFQRISADEAKQWFTEKCAGTII